MKGSTSGHHQEGTSVQMKQMTVIYRWRTFTEGESMSTNLLYVGNELAVFKRYKVDDSTIIEATILDEQQTKELYARVMPTMPAK